MFPINVFVINILMIFFLNGSNCGVFDSNVLQLIDLDVPNCEYLLVLIFSTSPVNSKFDTSKSMSCPKHISDNSSFWRKKNQLKIANKIPSLKVWEHPRWLSIPLLKNYYEYKIVIYRDSLYFSCSSNNILVRQVAVFIRTLKVITE